MVGGALVEPGSKKLNTYLIVVPAGIGPVSGAPEIGSMAALVNKLADGDADV